MRCRLACILAAGRGVRLGASGLEQPKGFLRLGQSSIIEESISKLLASGVDKIVLVTGHAAHCYQDLSREYPSLTLVHNERFSDSGSLYSLCCATSELTEPFLLLESDLIYERRALDLCQQSGAENLVLVSGYTQAGDEVYVQTRGHSLVAMSKVRDSLGPEIMGEFVGICRISPELLDQMVAYGESRFSQTLLVDYETDALVACAQDREIFCHLVPDLTWAEIDTPEHLERVRTTVYPILQSKDSKPSL